MRDTIVWVMKVIVLALLIWIGILCIMQLVTVGTMRLYEYQQVSTFNRIHNTSYTTDEWSIHEYEIKKRHPLFIEE